MPSPARRGMPPARLLRMLLLRHIVEETGQGVKVADGQHGVLEYYANAISHL